MIRESTKELAKRGKEITIEEWNNTPLNTYERQYLFEFLSNELIIAICKVYNDYTEHTKEPTTYNETVLTLLFPELIKRFEASECQALIDEVINVLDPSMNGHEIIEIRETLIQYRSKQQ